MLYTLLINIYSMNLFYLISLKEFSGPEVTAQPISILSEYDIGIDSNTNEGRNNYERPEVKRQQNNRLQNDRWAELEDEAFEYYDSNNYYGINETQELKQVNFKI